MLNLKSTVAVSMVFAFFSGASLADGDAMPVYPATEPTAQTCKEAHETALIYRQLDGDLSSPEPVAKCDDAESATK